MQGAVRSPYPINFSNEFKGATTNLGQVIHELDVITDRGNRGVQSHDVKIIGNRRKRLEIARTKNPHVSSQAAPKPSGQPAWKKQTLRMLVT